VLLYTTSVYARPHEKVMERRQLFHADNKGYGGGASAQAHSYQHVQMSGVTYSNTNKVNHYNKPNLHTPTYKMYRKPPTAGPLKKVYVKNPLRQNLNGKVRHVRKVKRILNIDGSAPYTYHPQLYKLIISSILSKPPHLIQK
jgi:hypothetical protein